MNTYISVCGSDCRKCCCFESGECTGCNECKGKVFHVSEGEACAIYNCCVTEHGYSNCLDCEKIPCGIWNKTRDPKFSDEEFEKNIAERIALLREKR